MFMASQLNVKSLRLRLGWSQADLARRLSCSIIEVNEWEHGQCSPNIKLSGQLELLFSQAETCAFELQTTPKAENICKNKHLGQVPMYGLEDSDKK
jgi:transcriptional regulator with XRE-family HTH domain